MKLEVEGEYGYRVITTLVWILCFPILCCPRKFISKSKMRLMFGTAETEVTVGATSPARGASTLLEWDEPRNQHKML